MKKLNCEKFIRSLYCVNVPCTICGESMSVKIWHSFRGTGTYFCKECVQAVCKRLSYDKSVDLERMDAICKEVEIERKFNNEQ